MTMTTHTKLIPLRSIVLVDEPILSAIDKYELRSKFLGDIKTRDVENLSQNILHTIVKNKLIMGQTAIVYDRWNKPEKRQQWINYASSLDIPLFFFFKERQRFAKDELYASILDPEKTELSFTKSISRTDTLSDIKSRGFKGITVIPDVHGNYDSLLDATSWAIRNNNFIVFLGDLVDYGSDSVSVIDHVWELVARGTAVSCIGNHERKLQKILFQPDYKGNISSSNQITLDQLNQLTAKQNLAWKEKFRAFINTGAHHWNIGEWGFAHAAFDSKMKEITNQHLFGRLEKLAVFGEVGGKREDGFPKRTYNWCKDLTFPVIVGHDIRSRTLPVNDGTVIFLDTGSSKDGVLTVANIDIETMRLTHYNQF